MATIGVETTIGFHQSNVVNNLVGGNQTNIYITSNDDESELSSFLVML
jgi:hypothetical protein